MDRPAGDRPRLGQEAVLAAAVKLLDEVGLEGLSLRRLAQKVGVQAPALYWYFRSKRELMDHLAAEILNEAHTPARPGPGQAWDDWLMEGCRVQRRALLAHRDGARVVAGTRRPAALSGFAEEMVDALCAAGFGPGFALRSIVNLGNFVGGFVTEEQAAHPRLAADPGLAAHPRLAAAMREVGDPNGDDGFEHGLRLMIDGMRVALQHSGVEAAR